jgi:hypothetical protein
VNEAEMLKRPNYRRAEYGGVEKLCPKCGEWWPADAEFFYQNHGRLHSWCKACMEAWKRDRKARGVTDHSGRLIRRVSA